MKKTSKRQITGKVDPATIESNNLFVYEYDPEATPSVNLANLLAKLSIYHLEMMCYDPFIDLELETRYTIHDVILKGSSGSIVHNLYDIRPHKLKYIDEYVGSIESLESRFYEISKCRFLVLEFMYEINVHEPNFINPNKWYVVHFSTQGINQQQSIHASQLTLTAEANIEIDNHVLARNTFLSHMLQFLDLKLAQLNMLSREKPVKRDLEKNAKKEKNLLEVWLALEKDDYLKEFEGEQLTMQRKAFFEIFNLVDRNFHTNHSNWNRNKTTKGNYLKDLLNLVVKNPEKAKKGG